MGQSLTKVKRFLSNNPICIFCGGVTPSTSQDHIPARSIFIDRKWPEGYVFSACDSCNNSSSDAEYLVSFLTAVGWDILDASEATKQKAKEVFEEFIIRKHSLAKKITSASTNQKWALARQSGFELSRGATHSQIPLAKLPPEFDAALKTFGVKLAKALHYLHSGNQFILPAEADITAFGETNTSWLRGESFQDYELFNTLFPVQNLRRENIVLSQQFSYSYGMTGDFRNSVFICRFGHVFNLALFVVLDSDEFGDSVNRSIDSLSENHSPIP